MKGGTAAKKPNTARRVVWIALAVGVALIAAGGVRRALRLGVAPAVAGVELGMDPDRVQRAFTAPAPGFFSVGSEGGEPTILWRPSVRADDVPEAVRFVFEERALVEVEAVFDPDVEWDDVKPWAGAELEPTDDGVVQWSTSGERHVLTVSER